MSLKVHAPQAGGGLLERDEQFATLFEALSDARIGRGRVVFVAGEAGAGKTSLARGFCDAVDDRARILVGACDPLSTPRPLGPFLDVVEGDGELAELVRVGASPADVFGALHAWLGEQPTVLVLEDLHWGDEATLDVLRLLTRRIEDVPALVVATFRNDGLPRTHPMQILLGDLATATAVDRLSLPPLSSDAVRELALGHDVDPDELYRTTEGNPFFVTQVLATGYAGVPATVRDAVLARSASLDRAALDLLETIALVPPRAEPWLLDAVAGDSLDRIEDCLSSGLVAIDERGVSFRHELARLATVDVTPSTRRRAIHRRVLAALAGRHDQELDYARLAHHAEAAGDAAAVLLYAPEAARSAATAGAYREAAAQYERALRFGAALEPGERAELLEGRSRACYLADDQLEAIEVIREAIRCRQEQRAPLQEARALSELADYLSCRGFLCDAQETKDRASRLVEGHAEQREHAYVLQAAGRFRLDGDYDASIELGGRAVEIGERFGDEHVAGHARVTVGVATGRRDLDAGLRLLEEAVQLARGTGQPEVVARAFNAMGYICAAKYRHEQADAYYEAGLEHCAEHTSDLWRINMLALSGLSFLAQGRFDDASRRAAAILDDPRESPWPHHTALVVLALVRARRGDPARATRSPRPAPSTCSPKSSMPSSTRLRRTPRSPGWTADRRRFAMRPRRRCKRRSSAATRRRPPGSCSGGASPSWRRACRPMSRAHTRWRLPAGGSRLPTSGRGVANRTRRHSRSPSRVTSPRSAERTPSSSGSVRDRSQRWSRENCATSARATSHVGRAGRRGRTTQS